MSASVVLLEDHPMVRELVEAVLADHGHEVRTCASRAQVLSAARDAPGSLAVADFRGRSHRALEDDERREIEDLARSIPTIPVTGRAWGGEASVEDLGLLALVREPFDVDALAGLVAACAGRALQVGAATSA